MFIPRVLQDQVIHKIKQTSKAIIIYGARQVGKTTLVNQILKSLHYRVLKINADEFKYIDVLSSRDAGRLKGLVSGYELLFIDEAQRVPDIGINLKILIDQFPNLKLITTGSSSFELASRISEPLTGRTWTYRLYPIAMLELQELYNPFELNQQLENRLVFGSYPEIFSLPNLQDKKHYLGQMTASYLYKDILEFVSVKNARKIQNLLKLLAFQIGSEVSMSELGTQLEMSKDTVQKYVDLLEKAFVVFRLSGLSRNLRKEVSKMDKIYFYDLGVRNSVIDNLKPLSDRNDLGRLWENFLIAERAKVLSYRHQIASIYFWRTYTGAELDYVEERGGFLYGYEFKYSSKKKVSAPKAWLDTYPNAQFQAVNSSNYLNFVT